jgi:hypothetical protein
MESIGRHFQESDEFMTPEGCFILESWNNDTDPAVSIARARVKPGVTTKLHSLVGIVERYLIIAGSAFSDNWQSRAGETSTWRRGRHPYRH